MSSAGLQFSRKRGEDRFYNPAKARMARQSFSCMDKLAVVSVNRKPVNRTGSKDAPKLKAASEPVVRLPLSNLERFLEAITPSVPAQFPPKHMQMWGRRTCDMESHPYFILDDLWESFKEWSAYGVGVPLILKASSTVIQYYVPYLSGIQIYRRCMKPSSKPRQTSEDTESDFRDSSSDGSSDYEPVRRMNGLMSQQDNPQRAHEIPLRMDRLSLKDKNAELEFREDVSSEEESVNSQGCLIFEYLEREPPFCREPLADKILDLAQRFSELKTLKSCDMLSSSWISVAWYPIYRIPMGQTLNELEACFLTYHSLSTPLEGVQNAQAPVVRPLEMNGVPKMMLPVVGLASYKFRGSLWTPTGGAEQQLAKTLLQAARNQLQKVDVRHPDFMFFCSR